MQFLLTGVVIFFIIAIAFLLSILLLTLSLFGFLKLKHYNNYSSKGIVWRKIINWSNLVLGSIVMIWVIWLIGNSI